jgi:hypothetical protein
MEPRRFAWESQAGLHELVLAWVSETSSAPYVFGHGAGCSAIQLASFYIGTTPVT